MTLKTLSTNIEVQGDIRISIWDDMGSEEIEVHELRYVNDLRSTLYRGDLYHLRNLPVTFLFAPGDGFLHIELRDVRKGK